jgi:hypothetical protein
MLRDGVARRREQGAPTTFKLNANGQDHSGESLMEIRIEAAGNALQKQAATGQGQGATPAVTAPPAPTAPGRVITIQGRNGAETITLPSDFSAGDVIPPQAVDISIAFFITIAIIIIGLPIARALSRRMDRRAAPAQISNELSSQLTQLTQAVDAIALEVERISEGQRFTTRLLSEQRDAGRQALPSSTDRG